MRILSQSLKNRDGKLAVALWAELAADITRPVAWIVEVLDHEPKEWRHDSEHDALRHFEDLRAKRYARAPRAYEVRP